MNIATLLHGSTGHPALYPYSAADNFPKFINVLTNTTRHAFHLESADPFARPSSTVESELTVVNPSRTAPDVGEISSFASK
jgi:hypothetical protein